jgi:non-lysosomal glucosylceramidase
MPSLPSHSYSRPGPGHPNGVQLGGLGAGRVELGSNGRITLAGITNNWQRLLTGLDGSFFFLRAQEGGRTWFHLLQDESLDGSPGAEVEYEGVHPVARVRYRLDGCPVQVSLTAFSPLAPHDLESSAIPGALFTFRLENSSKNPLRVRLGFSWEHLGGCGGGGARGLSLESNRTGNRIDPWRGTVGAGLRFTGGSEGRNPNARGEMIVATEPKPEARLWGFQSWNILADRSSVLAALHAGLEPERFGAGSIDEIDEKARQKRESPPSWDDPDPRFGGGKTAIEGSMHPAGITGVEVDLVPGGAQEITFVLAWHMPVHQTLLQPGTDHGHFYCRRFADVAAVADELLARRKELFTATVALHEFLASSGLPAWLGSKCLNDQTAVTTNSIVTRSGQLYTLEASPMMFGALGTLDQRLVSHPGMSLFYPELNRTELRMFASLQASDGSLPHFNGNAYTALGSDAVEYGRTGWPDLACSFIIQCYRDWTETGDPGFFDKMLPVIQRAADWLMAADQDGDGVPEGGSSWDIEHYPGCFIATATVWLATLRVLEEIAIRSKDPVRQEAFRRRFDLASNTVDGMWTGTHYLKCLDPVSGLRSDDVFVGQLAGEWIVRQLGLAPVLPTGHTRTALETIYRLNGNRDLYKLMPIQVRPDGSLPDRKYAWHAWPQYSMVFVDCLALYLGLREPALESLRAFDEVVRLLNRTPWATTLWYDARTGRPDFEEFMGLDWYMNTPASWWVLSALTGFAANEPAESITMGPGVAESTFPVLTPRYWARLRFVRAGENRTVTLTPERFFRGATLTLRVLRWRGPETRAVIAGQACTGEPGNGITTFRLPAPLTLSAGQNLEILFS